MQTVNKNKLRTKNYMGFYKNLSKILFILLLGFLSGGGCDVNHKIPPAVQAELNRANTSIDELIKELDRLPPNVRKELDKSITNLEYTLRRLTTHYGNTQYQVGTKLLGEFDKVGVNLIGEFGTELDGVINDNIQEVRSVLGELVNLHDTKTKEQIDKARIAAEILIDKTSLEFQEIVKMLDQSAQRRINQFGNKLDQVLEKNNKLVDQIIEARINQLSNNLNQAILHADRLLEARLVQLDAVITSKIQYAAWGSRIVAKDIADVKRLTVGQSSIIVLRVAIIFLTIALLGLILKNYVEGKFVFKFKKNLIVLAAYLLITIPLFSDSILTNLIGPKFLLQEDINKIAENRYQQIESWIFAKKAVDDDFINYCEDTFEMYAICKFLTSSENQPRLNRYSQRMKNVSFVLSKVNEFKNNQEIIITGFKNGI